MKNLLKSNFNENIIIVMQEQWTKQCQKGKLKSIQEFAKKEQRFKENRISTSKPKNESARVPNKQEKQYTVLNISK